METGAKDNVPRCLAREKAVTVLTAVEVAPGEYEIGSDCIPNAGPRHLRSVRRFWIDSWPVTWAHFEAFVAAGGYERADELLGLDRARSVRVRPDSVDGRCRVLIEQAEKLRKALLGTPSNPGDEPITGITWFEAREISRFYGARLPFEVEWEVAMQGCSGSAARDSATFFEQTYPMSRFGCAILIGCMQEWTEDRFSQRYWRADIQREGIAWDHSDCETPVTVRGACPDDVYRNVTLRVGKDRASTNPYRGFRRVWDRPPSDSELNPNWREYDLIGGER
jgi:formylglycine-generating enzyme required for sulfatase activity